MKHCFSPILPPFFEATLVVFILNQLMESRGIYIPFVHSYLDDLLVVPIMLGGILVFQQQITYRNPAYVFSVGHVVVMVLMLSWYFEWYAPGRKDNHYGDPWDVLAYTIGGVFFYIYQNKPAEGWVKFTRIFPFLTIISTNGCANK